MGKDLTKMELHVSSTTAVMLKNEDLSSCGPTALEGGPAVFYLRGA